MSNIGTNHFSKGLYQKAQDLSKDGLVTPSDRAELIKVANDSGINKSEKKFLTGLLDQNNVDKLKVAPAKAVAVNFSEPTDKAGKQIDFEIKIMDNGGTALSLEKFNKLSESSQNRFTNLFEQVSNKGELLQLLNTNKISQRAFDGGTVLYNLSRISETDFKNGVNKDDLMCSTISVLCDRNNITQGPHGTCGAASLEYLVLQNDVGDFTKIIADLAINQKSTLRDKSELLAAPSSLKFHKGDKTSDGSTESRIDSDIIFQSAVMQRVKLTPFTNYNVEADNSDLKSVLTGNSAANPWGLSSLAESITGKKFETRTKDFITSSTKKDLVKDVESGKNVIALINNAQHYVTVTIVAIKDNKVTYRDSASETNKEVDANVFFKGVYATISPK